MNFAIGTSEKPRKLIIYDPRTSPRRCWDGKNYLVFSTKQIFEFGVLRSNRSRYLPIPLKKGETFEEAYEKFVSITKTIKKQSRNKIDLFQTGSFPKAALQLFFDQMNVENIVPDPIDEKEGTWLMNTDQGQLIYADTYIGEAHNYDVVSMYLSIMKNKYFRVPMKAGVFKKLTKKEFQKMQLSYFEFGIYRCEIDFSDNEDYRKVMRVNKQNYYTSNDLAVAKALGLKLEIVQDEEDNFLHYGEGTCKQGSELFTKFVNLLYGLRCKTGNKDFKTVGNCLWGALSQLNSKRLEYDNTKELNFDLDDEQNIVIEQGFTRDDRVRVDYVPKVKIFKYNWARIKPFIIAKGRETMSKLMTPHLEYIHRINTDGFLSSRKLNIKVGADIGDLRYEGCIKNCRVEHVNRIIDLDKEESIDLGSEDVELEQED